MAETASVAGDVANLSLNSEALGPSNEPEGSKGAETQPGESGAGFENEGGHKQESWRKDEFPPLALDHEALKLVTTREISGHGECVKIDALDRGSFHEVRVLEFEDGWTCVGRFTRRRDEHRHVRESAVATMKYVREHTTIPVPEIYHVNFDQQNDVGASYVIMERMPGQRLYTIWEGLSTEHKIAVMEQIADVLAQLSNLKFDKIGSFNLNGEIGPLQNHAIPHEVGERGPFNTMEDYLLSFIPDTDQEPESITSLYPTIRHRIHEDLTEQTDDPLYNPPFRLIHGDFDGQNMLFTTSDSGPPKLTGIIDWDYSYAGPLYYLYEHPVFILDIEGDYDEPNWPENKILRQKLVSTLLHEFPRKSEARLDVREAFRQKSYLYNAFASTFMFRKRDAKDEADCIKLYTRGIDGTITVRQEEEEGYSPYGLKLGWEPDSDPESEDGRGGRCVSC